MRDLPEFAIVAAFYSMAQPTFRRVAIESYDARVATAFGLHAGQVCVMIHCGSRGLGHQICTDHVRVMEEAMPRYGIQVPDRQLACAPVESPEGRAYLGAMAAAANYGRANRQLLGETTRRAFETTTGAALDLVYDVSHNLAKIELHHVDGRPLLLCVHRKGATRALPPWTPRSPSRPHRSRSAGPDPWHDGYCLPCPDRDAGRTGLVLHEVGCHHDAFAGDRGC